MSVILYGLRACDSCRKARKWLDRFDVEFRFVDYRDEPLSGEQVTDWASQLGGFEAMVNKSSTTWRNLLPQRKDPGSDAEWRLLLREHPALIKRPVVAVDGEVRQGFSDNAFKKRFGKG